MAVETAHSFGRKVNAHARSMGGIQACVKAGVDVLFHCEFTDDETLDLMEAAKDRIFVAPTVSLFHAIVANAAAGFGLTAEIGGFMGIPGLLEASIRTHTELRKRGVRHLIGGDYGFAWSRHGTNARDLQFFVEDYGYTPADALVCATRNGGLAMRSEGDLGTLTSGALADMILVDGDPLKDVSILTDKDRLVMIMKDGQLHKNQTGAIQRRVAA
jgi:imidazolonepropionase-like amidohydrolase